MASRHYSNEFTDVNNAVAFGKEVDFIAVQKDAMIPTGKKRSKLKCLLGAIFIPEDSKDHYVCIGEFYVIQKDSHRERYYVKYANAGISDYWRSDQIRAERFVTDYLEKRYQEICQIVGHSRI